MNYLGLTSGDMMETVRKVGSGNQDHSLTGDDTANSETPHSIQIYARQSGNICSSDSEAQYTIKSGKLSTITGSGVPPEEYSLPSAQGNVTTSSNSLLFR